MEKDYFKDRPKESTDARFVQAGTKVLICTKAAQKYAKVNSDLTCGTVIRVLSRGIHPRGIKVEILTIDGDIAIGRVVYISGFAPFNT